MTCIELGLGLDATYEQLDPCYCRQTSFDGEQVSTADQNFPVSQGLGASRMPHWFRLSISG